MKRFLFAVAVTVAILAWATAHADPAPVIVPPLRCSSETEYGCYDYQLWLPVIEVSA